MRFAPRCALLAAGLFLTACQEPSAPEVPYDYKALVARDIQAMDSLDSASAQAFDGQYQNAFSQLFGGTDTQSVRSYLDQRIHYYWTLEDLNSVTMYPTDFVYNKWADASSHENANGGMAAANLGVELWLRGLVDHVEVRVMRGDVTIPVTSPNVGLMLIGPWYRPADVDGYGYKYNIPAIHRQSILLHEARHSDCTGGVTETDLQVLRDASSYHDTDEKFKKECSHLHTFCPPDHEFAGLLACDDLPWGAYSVAYVYGKALAPSTSGVDRSVMDIEVMDNYGRLMFDSESMLDGRMGAPDMSSQGLLE
jgi:hypothetical protein